MPPRHRDEPPRSSPASGRTWPPARPRLLRAVLYVATALCLVLAQPTAQAAASHDGKRFDPGATMTRSAKGAPSQLALAAFMIGEWDVAYRTYNGGKVARTATARSTITYFNRGYGLMERLHCPDVDGAGHPLDTLGLLVYSVPNSAWGLGEANSRNENITVYSGAFQQGRLVLHDARRRRGRLPLMLYRQTIEDDHDGAFTVEVATSSDFGHTWTTSLVKSYTRRKAPDDIFHPATDDGTPAQGLPPKAHQFDFLVGEWDFQHDMTLPSGKEVRFPAKETAVYMLGGHAVMEYTWYDVDTHHPDEATTIVRLYNRNMRQWESLYCDNRSNGLLHFAGVKEGDAIVLHELAADAADVPWNRWTFHDIGPKHYGWYDLTSRDRGETWAKTWTIEADRATP